jgi:phosphatidylserine/phosphatidylglycerophosphate/cardiolipin synthase-like enzyme
MSAPQPHIPFPAASSYPARPGNLVRPLIDGTPAFRRICEAVEAARRSVWVAVTFIREGFEMPDGRGTFFDLLDRAAARGLDVRVIFWRPNPEATYVTETGTCRGSPRDLEMLRARGSRFRIRWDRAHGAFCQHQKCWMVDAGQPGETAFVGGININPRAMRDPGHDGGGGIHDAYVEVAGPAATDVHHNFAQRWNDASERHLEDGTWGHDGDDDLALPQTVSAARGTTLVQIQRNVLAGLYRAIEGESTIRMQYIAAIDAARRSIYIENQALAVAEIIECLGRALERGVEVVALLPAEPESWVGARRRMPEHKELFDAFTALGGHESFALVGIAGRDPSGARRNVYVHAKLMLVDDAWATIGSCNLHRGSLFGNTELNASFWCPETVRSLRCTLLSEHLGTSTDHLDDREALRAYRKIARENARKHADARTDWQGIAFSLDTATYGL